MGGVARIPSQIRRKTKSVTERIARDDGGILGDTGKCGACEDYRSKQAGEKKCDGKGLYLTLLAAAGR